MIPRNPSRHRQNLGRFASLCVAVAMITSCANTPDRPPIETQTTQSGSHSWRKVRSNPPTWYPHGVAADHPTDHHSGEWVYTEDAQGTRFFVPFHGLPKEQRNALIAEALAARNPDKVRRIENQEAGRIVATGATAAVTVPVMAAGAMAISILIGMGT